MEPKIRTNHVRVGNFTSSTIGALMSNGTAKNSIGKPAHTYIEECNMERRLGRSLENDSNAKHLSWGKLVEKRVFELLGLEYKLVSENTLEHPTIDYWCGSPDAQKFDEGGTVVDIKCPMTLKSFCQLVDSNYPDNPNDQESKYNGIVAMDIIRSTHKEGEKYYWQLVSNAILINAKYAELIVYVPYQNELQSIRDLAQQMDELHRYYWVANSYDDDLPNLIEGGFYNNLNVIRFEIPQEDKDALTERVKLCGEQLIKI